MTWGGWYYASSEGECLAIKSHVGVDTLMSHCQAVSLKNAGPSFVVSHSSLLILLWAFSTPPLLAIL